MQEFILFIMCFCFVLLIYEIFIVTPAKKRKNSKNQKKGKSSKKDPIEVRYLITRYHLDMNKISYPQLLQIVALVSSFDISLIVTLVLLLDSYLLQLLLAIVVSIPIILVSYHMVGKFYQKKGMSKDV